MRLTDIPVERPVGTLMLLVSLMVLGVVSLFLLPMSDMPTLQEPSVEVNVPYPGSHPLETLRDIVRPIEEEISTIPGVTGMWSNASDGNGFVEANFSWDEDIEIKKMEVREAVERARPRLPDDIGRITIQGDIDSMSVGVEGGSILSGRISSSTDLSQSWELLDRRIRRPLERVKGVASVRLGGVEPRQVRIDVDEDAFRRHGIRPRDVITALESGNADVDLGSIRGDIVRYDVRSLGRFRSLEEIENIAVGPGRTRLQDFATVELRQPELDYGRHLDREFAISLDVFREPAANTVAVVDELMARIHEIEEDPQLEGITLLVWYDAGAEIRNSIAKLRNAGLFGGFLAIFVLYGFLRRVRATLIVSVAIPFSLLVTFAAMYLIKAELNIMTMLGLMFGVGMLVDNAVVVMENIYRRQGEGLPPKEAARRGTREVALAVLASTATSIIVWSWLFVSDRTGMTILMGAVAMTICLSVACSLLISLTFIPLAASRFTPSKGIRPGILLSWVIPRYRTLLGWTLRHRMATLLGLVALASSAAIPIVFIEKSDQPNFREPAVGVRMDYHGGTTVEAMEKRVDILEEWLWSKRDELGFENVYTWYTEWGHANTLIYLPSDQVSEEGLERVRTALREDLPEMAGVKIEVGERMWGGRRRGGGRERRFVGVALHGEDPEYLRDIALDVEKRMRTIPDAKEVYGPTTEGREEALILVDPERARDLGVTPQAVAETVGFALRGRHMRRFQQGDAEIDMLVTLRQPDNPPPVMTTAENLLIPREDGPDTPLGSVADVVLSRTDERIHRENRETTEWITAEFDTSVTTDEGRKRIETALAGLRLPEGYGWDWGKRGWDRDEGLGVMLRGIILAMVVVVLLMMALFESFTQPIAILVTLPLAFFGGFWALWLGGYVLEPVGFMGVIILIGIVVNNGIVMVDHVNALRREGMNRVDALIRGCGDRLRPVLMTAITTLCGLMPLAVSRPTVVNAYIDTLPVVVVGGLATSTIFTLIALPVWYTIVEDFGSILFRLFPKRMAGAAVRRPVGAAVVSGGGGSGDDA